MSDARALLQQYFRQQRELGMPPYVFSPGLQVPATMATLGCATLTMRADAAAPATVSDDPSVAPPFEAGRPAAEAPVSVPAPSDARQAMVELYRASRSCAGCGLGAARTTFVFGAGNVRGRVMVIGEAPGAEEDRQGLPFVGAAGQLLTKMLAAVSLDRDKDVFITNVLKCRPPENRTPEAPEVTACLPTLKAQIDTMRPAALLLLGRTAAQAVLGCVGGVGQLRTAVHDYQGIPAVVTYHPAALLRKESLKREAWEDLQRLRNILQPRGDHASTAP